MAAKILLFDIETAPMQASIWGMWKQNIPLVMIKQDWYMLTWAAKWLGADEVMYDSLHLHGDHKDDTPILHSIHALLDEADIVVAHNGNKFDIKKVNARFIQAGINPPSPYRKIDTLLEARKNFAFTSNRLDALGEVLGLGRKMDTGGFALWAGCLEGDTKSFEKMVEYNVQDVELLESVYQMLRPWMNNHPNVSVYDEEEVATCPKCASTNIHWRGTAKTAVMSYHRFQCQDCGGWGRGRESALSTSKRKSMVVNAQ